MLDDKIFLIPLIIRIVYALREAGYFIFDTRNNFLMLRVNREFKIIRNSKLFCGTDKS